MKKVYYRDTNTGELAYLVDDPVHGKRLRLNRPSEEIYYHVNVDQQTGEINNGRWKPVKDIRPLTPYHIAEISYSCDRALCRSLGIMNTKEWALMKDTERRDWINAGPPEDEENPCRAELYVLIVEYLSKLSR